MNAQRAMVAFVSIAAILGASGCFQSARPSDDAPIDLDTAASGVVLARLCSFVPEEELCTDPTQAAAFIDLLDTVRALVPTPAFRSTEEFLEFVEGKGSPSALYPTVVSLLGPENPLLAWMPITIPHELRPDLTAAFFT